MLWWASAVSLLAVTVAGRSISNADAAGEASWASLVRRDGEDGQGNETESAVKQCGNSAADCFDFIRTASIAYAYTYCVNVVLTNRTAESANATDMLLGGIRLPYSVNATDSETTVRIVAGTSTATARIVDGFGCQSVYDEIVKPVYATPSEIDAEAPEAIVNTNVWPEAKKGTPEAFENIDYAALEKIVQKEFDEDVNATYVRASKTKAVVVAHKGAIVAEGYSEWLGITAETPLVGWSMTKTLTAAMVGMRIADQKIALDNIAANQHWTIEEKLERNISLRNLLQMTSGIEWDEEYSPVTDVTRMLYSAPDAPAYVSRRPQRYQSGTNFSYSSGDTNLVQHALRLSFGEDGGDKAYWSYLKNRLLNPIGATSFQMMTDSMGNFVGSSNSVATARDWARVGQLYVNGGKWDDNEILSPEWIDFTTTPTEISEGEYGAGLWMIANDENVTGPSQSYYLGGYGKQVVAIFPAKELVVVRLGYTLDDSFDRDAFLAEIATLFPVVNDQ